MDTQLFEEFEKKALLWADGFGYCDRDKFRDHPQILLDLVNI